MLVLWYAGIMVTRYYGIVVNWYYGTTRVLLAYHNTKIPQYQQYQQKHLVTKNDIFAIKFKKNNYF
jgi:hypothetical protein